MFRESRLAGRRESGTSRAEVWRGQAWDEARILETGEVAPEVKARHGDYPAMFRALLGAVDPGMEFATVSVVGGEMPASPRQADAWLVTRVAARGLRRVAVDRAAEGVPAGVRGGAGAGGRHLLRPPDPRRGAGRAGGEVRPWLGARGAGLRGGAGAPGSLGRCRERFSVRALHQDQVVEVAARTRTCWRARRIAPSPRSPAYGDRRLRVGDLAAAASGVRAGVHGRSCWRYGRGPPSRPGSPARRGRRWRAGRRRTRPGRGPDHRLPAARGGDPRRRHEPEVHPACGG